MTVRALGFLIIATVGFATAELVLAQAGWRQALPALEDGDIERIQQVARQEMTGKPVGTTLGWTNEQTGNHGTVDLADRFSREERECRTLNHVIEMRRSGRWRYTVTICRTPDGKDWRWENPRDK